MSDAEIARQRAAKAAQAQDLGKEANELDACIAFFASTGGTDCWQDKWGWGERAKLLKKYSGIKITPEGNCAELMLPFNGLNNQRSALPDGGLSSDWGAAMNGFRMLQSVNLHGNKLEGKLEEALERACERTTADQFLKRPYHFAALRNLDLCRNAFTGPFPNVLLDVPTLEWINFSRNKLTGSLPDGVSKLKSLKLLDLSYNQFGGHLPSRGLRTLWKLQCLNLSNNDLLGKVSPDLSRLTSLVVLNLGNNKFTGKLPDAIAELTGLKKLDCRANSLTGTLPVEIFENCPLLIQLNLSDNTLTGPLPEALSLLTQLRQMHLGTNQFTGMLPVNVLGALGKPGNLRLLDLSDNALVVTDYEATLLTAKLPTGCEINLDPTSDPAEAKS